MPLSAIDNTNLVNLCNNCGAVGFLPVIAFAYDAVAKTVTLTNTSTISAGDTFLKVKVQVFDKFGGEVRGTQTVLATPLVIDVSTLNAAETLDIKVVELTTGKIAADGGAYRIGAAGSIGMWDIQKNA